MYRESFGQSVKRGFMGLPVALRTIIAINTVVFLLQLVVGGFFGSNYISYLSFVPEWKTALLQPWRIITYMFLHSTAGIFHYLFNMLWLWWMGRPVEEALGPRTFTVLYLGSGIGGALIDLFISTVTPMPPVIGASGAVFGIMVSFAMLFPRMPIMLILLPPIEARYVVAGLIGIEVLLLGDGSGVARLVHLGGALSGYLLIKSHKQGVDLSKIPRFFEYLWMDLKPKRKPNSNMRSVSDVEIVEEVEQSELDEILEKISQHGYDSLTKEEKRKLFELSKKGDA